MYHDTVVSWYNYFTGLRHGIFGFNDLVQSESKLLQIHWLIYFFCAHHLWLRIKFVNFNFHSLFNFNVGFQIWFSHLNLNYGFKIWFCDDKTCGDKKSAVTIWWQLWWNYIDAIVTTKKLWSANGWHWWRKWHFSVSTL